MSRAGKHRWQARASKPVSVARRRANQARREGRFPSLDSLPRPRSSQRAGRIGARPAESQNPGGQTSSDDGMGQRLSCWRLATSGRVDRSMATLSRWSRQGPRGGGRNGMHVYHRRRGPTLPRTGRGDHPKSSHCLAKHPMGRRACLASTAPSNARESPIVITSSLTHPSHPSRRPVQEPA